MNTPTVVVDKQPNTILGGVALATPATRQAMLYSLWEGVGGTAMVALAETFGVAAAVSLHCPAMAIALLGSLPLLLSSLLQLSLPYLLDTTQGRKRYVVNGVTFQCLFLAGAAASGFLAEPYGSWVFVLTFVGYGCSGNAVSALWMAWISSLVPIEVRGRHFAWRGRVFSAVHLTCALSAGLLSRRYTSATAPWIFFALAFGTAALFRLGSMYCLQRQFEPQEPPQNGLPARQRLEPRYVKFVVTNALLQGATALAGPFFNVWYLRDLGFDYLTLSVAAVSPVVGSIVSLPLWGKLADSGDNRRVLHASALMVALIPVPYLFFSSPPSIWLFGFYSGVSWSGYGLASFNFILAAAGPHKPERAISYSVAATGVSVFLFGLLGGAIAPVVPPLNGWQLRSVFALSSLLRLVVVLVLFRVAASYSPRILAHVLGTLDQIPGYRYGLNAVRNAFRGFRKQ